MEWQPIKSAPKIDGHQILAIDHPPWGKPRLRIVEWNNGVGKTGYNWPCWMCSICTLSIDEDHLCCWTPLPEIPDDS